MKKFIVIFSVLAFYAVSTFAQVTVKLDNANTNGSTKLNCGDYAYFYDQGGDANNYSGTWTYWYSFYCDPGSQIVVTFEGNFGVGPATGNGSGSGNNHYLNIYDGEISISGSTITGSGEWVEHLYGTTRPTGTFTSTTGRVTFVHRSSSNTKYRGWKAKVSVACPDMLPSRYLNCQESSEFTDGFGDYAANSNFTKTYSTIDGANIRVNFTSFNLGTGDYLEAYNYVYNPSTDDYDAVLIDTYDASNPPSVITSSGNSMYFHFVSDDDGSEGAGWMARATSVGCFIKWPDITVNCLTTVDFSDGVAHYANNLSYYQTFVSQNYARIQIGFSAFDMTDDDFIEIHDGSTISSPLVGRYTGTTLPPSVTSTGNTLTVAVYSNEAGNGAGWDATVSAIDCMATLPGEAVPCGTSVDFTAEEGKTLDQEYYTKTFSSTEPLTIHFSSFNIGADDHFYIYDGSDASSTPVATYAAGDSPADFTSTGHSLTIKFDNNLTGIEAEWTATVTSAACSGVSFNFVPQAGVATYGSEICGQMIYDDGGPDGQYSNNCGSTGGTIDYSSGYAVIDLGDANRNKIVRISGKYTFDWAHDYITIFDGAGTDGEVLWGGGHHGHGYSVEYEPTSEATGCNHGLSWATSGGYQLTNPDQPESLLPSLISIDINVVSKSNAITIHFYSNGTIAGDGFAFDVTCENKPDDCYSTGTVIFREDFGGNSESDPVLNSESLGTFSVGGTTYNIMDYEISQYGTPCSIGSEGRYARPKFGSPCWKLFVPLDDHTHPGNVDKGYFLQVDALDREAYFYRQKIHVPNCNGVKLIFSFWMANINGSGNSSTYKPNLTFELHSSPNFTDANRIAYHHSGEIPRPRKFPYSNCVWDVNDWTQVVLVYEMPAEMEDVYFGIKNNQPHGQGNDFALDDIEVRVCMPEVTIGIVGEDEIFSSVNICTGSQVTLGADLVDEHDVFNGSPVYGWQRSDDNINWETIEFDGGESSDGLISTNNESRYGGNEITITEPNPTPGNPAPPHHYYRLIVAGNEANIESEFCRSISNTFTMEVTPIPEIVFDGTNYICEGSTIELGLTPESPAENLGAWSISSVNYDGTEIEDLSTLDESMRPSLNPPSGSQTHYTITGALPDAITIKFTTDDAHGGCWNEKTIPIYSLPDITISSGYDPHICEGEPFPLNATSPMPVEQYIWSDGEANPHNVTPPVGNTTYTVTATTHYDMGDGTTLQCADNESIVLNVAPLPTGLTITSVPDRPICPNTTITLTASAQSQSGGTIMYSWGDDAHFSTSGDYTVTPSQTTTYTVYVKDVRPDGRECTLVENNVEVLVYDPPVLSYSGVTNVRCNGESTGAFTLSATDGTPYGDGSSANPYYYQFSKDNGSTYTHATTGDLTQITFSNLPANSYNVVVMDSHGCTDRDVVTITQPTQAHITAAIEPSNVTQTCTGQTVGAATVTASYGIPYEDASHNQYYIYAWDDPSSSTTASISNLGVGTYNVTVSDANECTATASVTISDRHLPDYTLGGDGLTKCFSYPATELSVNLSTSNTINVESYSWSTTSGADAGLPATTTGDDLNAITVTPTAVGDYTYSVVVAAENGCSVTSNYSLSVSPVPTINTASGSGTKDQTKCYSDFPGGFNNIIFTYGGGATGVNFEWTSTPAPTCLSYDAGTMTISATGTAPTEGATYTYRAVTTTAAGNACAQAPLTGTITIYPELTVTATADHHSCVTGNIGIATATPHGGNASNYTYSWDNGETTATINGLAGGDYNVIVTDANNCTVTAPVNIVANTNPTISVSHTDVKCNGEDSGTITVEVTGAGTSIPCGEGTSGSPYYYEFSDNGGSSYEHSSGTNYQTYTFPVSTNGNSSYTYNIYVRDGNGCTVSTTQVITQPDELVAVIRNEDILKTCTDQSVGTATVTVTGGTQFGTAPDTYYNYAWNTYPTPTWDPNRNTRIITDLPVGSYQVTVSDAQGCTATAWKEITARPVPNINASTTADAVCLSSSTSSFSILNSSNTVDIASHSWSVAPTDGAGMPSNLTTASLEVAPIGISPYEEAVTYVYTDVVTADNGCIVSGTVSLTVNPTVVLTHTSGDLDQTLCFEKTLVPIVFEYSGGASGVTLTWGDPAPASTCLSYAIDNTTHTLTISEGGEPVAGTYRYRVDAVGAVSPCSNPYYEGIIIIRPQLTVTVTGDHQSCVSGNIGVVTAHPAGGKPFGTAPDTYYQYSWNTTPTPRTTQSINELAGGTYNVVVTDANTCTATGSVTIESKTNPSISIDVTNVLCHGFNTGAIQVTVTNHGTNAGTSNPYGEGTTTEPYFYLFSKDGGSNTEQSSGDDYYVHSFPNLLANTYNIYVRDGNDCVATATPHVTEPDTYVTAEITDANTIPTCQGQSVGALTVTADHGTPGTSPNPEYTYSWNTGATTASINELSAGMYTVVVTDGNGCSITTSKEVLPRPVPDFSLDVTGRADKCLYDNETELVVSNGGTGSTYAWSASSTDAGLPAGSDDATVTVTPAVGTHTYTVSITASNGCVVTASVPLTIYPVPTVALSGTVTEATCNGYDDGGFSLVATGGTIYDNGTNPSTPYYYQFSIDGGSNYTTYYSNSNTSVTAQFTDLLAQTYNVVVSDSHECTASVSGGVEVWQPTLVTATPSVVTEDCAGQAIGVATVTPNGGRIGVAPYPEYRYAWNKATNPWDEPRTTQEISGLAAGTYNVTVTDSYGCIGTNAVTIDPRPVPNINVSTTADAVCLSSSTREFSILNNHDVDIASHSWSVAPTTGAGMPSDLTAESLEVTPTGISPYEEPVTYVYTDVITAENGCVVSGTVSLTVNPTAILTHTSGAPSQTLCFDETLTDIVYTYSGGADGATLTWTETAPESTCLSWSVDPSAKTLTITEGTTPVAGTYRYTVQTTGAISPCDNPPLSGEIIIRPQLTVEITGVHQSCVTGNIGTATATPAGGNPGSSLAYTYEWNTSATSATISGLTGGDYSVVVTDGAGCTATSSVTIVEKVNPTIEVTSKNVSCYGADDGKITVLVTTPSTDNPTPYSDGPASQPYYYVFSSDNGATLYDSRGEEQYAQYTFTGLAADAHPVNSHTYNIYVRDGNDCTATEEVNITQPVTLTATIDTDNDVTNSCTGQAVGEATVVAHDGTGPYTYTWNTDPVQSLATATGLAIGTYTVTVEDDHHCIATAQVSIGNRPVPSITAETNTVVCESELPLTLTVVNAGNEVDIASYSWTVDPTENAGITSGTNGATLNVRPTNYTTHRYTQHIVAENGCEVEGYVELLVHPNPTVTLGDVTQPVCPSAGSIEIEATLTYTNPIATPAPLYTYTWTNDGSFAVASTEPSISDATTVTSTTATVSVPNDYCSHDYTLKLQVEDANHCQSELAEKVITVADETVPTISLIDPSYASVDAVPIDGCKFTFPDLTTLVSTSDACSRGDLVITQSETAGAVITARPSQDVVVTVSDECGHTDNLTITVNVPETLSASITTPTNNTCPIASGSDYEFGSLVSGATAPYTYSWTTATAVDGHPDQATIASDGRCHTYNITLSVNDDYGCTAESSVTFAAVDDENPQITCPASPISVSTDSHVNTADVTVPLPTGMSDNCTIDYYINDHTNTANASGTYPLGQTDVTYTIYDMCGNDETCPFSVIVTDDEPPCIGCDPDDPDPDNPDPFNPNHGISCESITDNTGEVRVVTDPGQNTYTHSGNDWNIDANDNVGIVAGYPYYALSGDTDVVDGENTTLNGQHFNVGTTTVTWYVSDGIHVVDCSFDVIVTDDQPPCIGCDPDPNDPNVNGISCESFTEVISGQNQITVSTSPAYVDTYTHSGTAWDITATDNVAVVSRTCVLSVYDDVLGDYVVIGSGIEIPSEPGFETLDGVTFSLGATLVTWYVSDGTFIVPCSFIVNVEDNELPCIGCDPTDPDPYNPENPTGISCTTIGNQVRDCTEGLEYYVHHNNETAPTDPADPTLTSNWTANWNVDADDNTGTDGLRVFYTLEGHTSEVTGDNTTLEGQIFNIGLTTVIWHAIDRFDNETTCMFTVSVADHEAPCIGCDPDPTDEDPGVSCNDIAPNTEHTVSVSTSEHLSYYHHNNDSWDVTATDNVEVMSVTYELDNVNCAVPSVLVSPNTTLNGQNFNIGTTKVVWTAVDYANNISTCEFYVTVTDDENPCIGCDPDDPNPFDPSTGISCASIVSAMGGDVSELSFEVGTDTDANTYQHLDYLWDVDANDNVAIVAGDPHYTLSGATTVVEGDNTTLNGQHFNVGETTVTWHVSDGVNTEVTCSFTITVVDDQPPCIGCDPDPSNPDPFDPSTGISCASIVSAMGGDLTELSFEVGTDDDVNTYLHTGEDWDVDANDNVTIVAGDPHYTLSGATTIVEGDNTTLNGQHFNVGTTTVTWHVSDGVNTEVTCSFTITVVDDQPPCIGCDPDPNNPDPFNPNSGISCASIVTAMNGDLTELSFEVGTDEHSDTYLHTGIDWDVDANDNVAIVAGDPHYTLEGATTVVEGANTTLNGQHFNVGETTVIWHVSDGVNQEVTCSFTVTVVDDEDPCIGCDPNDPNNPFDDDDPDGRDCESIVAFADGENMTINVGTSDFLNPSEYVNYYVHYNSGENGNWDITANDNVGIASVVCNLSGATTATGLTTLNGQQFNIGRTVVTWVVTDVSTPPNTSECTFVVIVSDDDPPIIGCDPDDPDNPFDPTAGISCSSITSGDDIVTVYTPDGLTYYQHQGTQWDVTANDNSGIPSIAYSLSGATTSVDGSPITLNGQRFNLGQTTVTWVATDMYGLTDTCTFVVNVLDIIAPGISCPPEIQNITCINDVPPAYQTYEQFVTAGGSAYDPNGIDESSFVLLSQESDGNTCPEVITRTYQIDDIPGNHAICTQTITIMDNVAPVITGLAPTINVTSGTNCRYPLPDFTEVVRAMASDNCTTRDNLTIVQSLEAGTANMISTNTDVTITVTDACGNTAQIVGHAVVPQTLTHNVSFTEIMCAGQTSTVTITGVGGTVPYTGVGERVEYAGAHSYVISDANGCTSNVNITISEPPQLEIPSISVVHVACFGESTGSASVSVTGGTPGYTYSWNTVPVQETQNATNLVAGRYTVTVTDTKGCSATSAATIEGQSALLVASIESVLPVACYGEATGSAMVSVRGGSPVYSYHWSTSPEQNTETATSLLAGEYMVTVSDSHGCTATATAVIEGQSSPLTTSFAAGNITDVACYGQSTGSARVDVEGGSPDYRYTWSTSPVQNSQTAVNLSAGSYVVTVTDSHECTSTAAVTISGQTYELTASFAEGSSVDVPCFGETTGSAIVTVSGGSPDYTYAWNTIPQQTTQAVSNLAAGRYTVTVTDAHGCTATSSVAINGQGTPLSPNVLPTNVTNVACNGMSTGSATVTVSGGTPQYQYSWNTSPVQNTQTIVNVPAGTYVVTITDDHGCTATANATISQPPLLEVSVTASDATCGSVGGTVTANVFGGAGQYVYSWVNTLGQTYASPRLSSVAPSTYNLTVTDGNGCSATTSAQVSAIGSLSARIDVVALPGCGTNISSGRLQAVAESGISPFSYIWNTGATTMIASNLQPGSYNVTITDNWGCSANATTSIEQLNTLEISVTNTGASCFGYNDASATVVALRGEPPYTYEWNNGASSPMLQNILAGSYTITVTDANMCTRVETIEIPQPDRLTLLSDVKQISCFAKSDGSIALTAEGGNQPYTFNVTLNESRFTGNYMANLPAGVYTMEVVDAKGCQSENTIQLIEPDEFLSSYNVTMPSCSGNNDGTIEISATGGTKPYMYGWDSYYTDVPLLTGLRQGQYTISVVDANKCTYQVASIMLTDMAGDCITIPNVFTPNGDGVNDTWIIDNIEMFPDATIYVFNRWGQMLYKATGNDEPWDGSYRGHHVPAGTYLYIVDLYQKTEAYKGTVTVLY
ncbi:MAG: HYR domain-containing protein [Bacteroidales bacterium]|nr:HYR domain-containing protein [Bacteroidales bacterium]